jgi:hypothetical protein
MTQNLLLMACRAGSSGILVLKTITGNPLTTPYTNAGQSYFIPSNSGGTGVTWGGSCYGANYDTVRHHFFVQDSNNGRIVRADFSVSITSPPLVVIAPSAYSGAHGSFAVDLFLPWLFAGSQATFGVLAIPLDAYCMG